MKTDRQICSDRAYVVKIMYAEERGPIPRLDNLSKHTILAPTIYATHSSTSSFHTGAQESVWARYSTQDKNIQ